MSNTLFKVMAKKRAVLEEKILCRLKLSGTLRAHEVDEELMRLRAVRLVANLMTALQNKPEIFVSYIESITDERIDEGVRLHELQLALIALEEAAWQIVTEQIPLKDQVHCLGLVTLVVGTAKDRVANIYLHHLEMLEPDVCCLRPRPYVLAGGTDSGPITEDDLNWQQGAHSGL